MRTPSLVRVSSRPTQTEEQIRAHTFKAEGGYEFPKIAALFAGTLSVNFGYEYTRTKSEGSSTGFAHTYTVNYPARKLKMVTKGQSSNEIDPQE
jgi:hypothetical protein